MSSKPIRFDTILRAYSEGKLFDRQVAINLCSQCENVPLEFINDVLKGDDSFETKLSMARGLTNKPIPKDVILGWLYPDDTFEMRFDPYHVVPAAGIFAASGEVSIGENHLYDRMRAYGPVLIEPALNFLNRRNIPYRKMLKCIHDFNEDTLAAFLGQANDLAEIERMIKKCNWCVEMDTKLNLMWSYVFEPLARRDFSSVMLMNMAGSREYETKLAAVRAVSRRWDLNNPAVLQILKNACRVIDDKKHDDEWSLMLEQFIEEKAEEIQEKFENNPRWRRSFEPPSRVYKLCAGNVLVVAEIPQSAEVRGNYHQPCRASRAIVVDIVGDFYGERIGVSGFDQSTVYRVGDKIKITDFDRTDETFATGFHFFCTEKEALIYAD